jgi:hypothetical protein
MGRLAIEPDPEVAELGRLVDALDEAAVVLLGLGGDDARVGGLLGHGG